MIDKPLEVLEARFPEFLVWLREISRYAQVEKFILLKDYKESVRVSFFTKENEYSVSVRRPHEFSEHIVQRDVNDRIIGESNAPIDNGYLGGGVSTRKPRAGEDWRRGNDLADGPYCKETWNKSKNDIVSYELVRVIRPVDPTCEPVNGPLVKEVK